MAKAKGNGLEEKLSDLRRYEHAAFARKYSDLAPTALELQAQNLGMDEGSRELMDEFVFRTDAGRKRAIQVYAGKYDRALGNLTIDELTSGYYGRTLDDIANQEIAPRIKKELGKFKSRKLGDIRDELKRANYVLSGDSNGYKDHNDEEKKKAREITENYGGVITILEILGNAYFEAMRPKIAKSQNQKLFEALAKELDS